MSTNMRRAVVNDAEYTDLSELSEDGQKYSCNQGRTPVIPQACSEKVSQLEEELNLLKKRIKYMDYIFKNRFSIDNPINPYDQMESDPPEIGESDDGDALLKAIQYKYFLEDRIAALEEYCLNVDHHNIPVPEKLQYLFTKTQGTYNYNMASYFGDLMQGIPSGTGKTEYENGDWHEGQYVNGMLHGSGVFFYKSTGEVRETTYKLNKEDGISKADFPNEKVIYSYWKDNEPQSIQKTIIPGDVHIYTNYEDGSFHGHLIEYYTTEDYIVVYTYDAGEKQGKGKKYTYKEQVD